MKRLSLLAVLLFILIQINCVSQTYIGLKAGLLNTPVAQTRVDKYGKVDIDYSPSFATSFLLNKSISKTLTIGTNLGYSTYKADYYYGWWNPYGGVGHEDMQINFGYLGLYIYPQLNFGHKVRFFINAGPCFGFLINSFAQGSYLRQEDYESDPINGDINGSAKEYLKPTTIAIMSCTGLQVEVAEKWMLITDFTFCYGPGLIDNYTFRHQLDLTFSVGFLYEISTPSIQAKAN